MMIETKPFNPSAVESDDLLATAILRGTAALGDAQVLAALLQTQDVERAETILHEAGSLDLLEAMGPIELAALGLQPEEIVRLMVASEFATRAIGGRNRRRKLGTLEETVRDLRLRAQAWPRTVIGLIGVDAQHRQILDRILFQGTLDWTPCNLPDILRESLRAGCVGIVVYRWAPRPEPYVTTEDRRIADELRIMGAVVGITLIDYLVIAEQGYWTGRCDDGWVV